MKKKIVCFLFFLFLFLPIVHSNLFVSLKTDKHDNLYPDETTTLFIILKNDENKKVDIDLSIKTEPGLKFFNGLKEIQAKSISVKGIQPGKKEIIPIKLKAANIAVGEIKEAYSISAEYFLENKKHVSTIFLKTRKSPMNVGFRLAKSIISENEGNKLFFDFKNVSKNQTIKNLKAEIVSPEKFSVKTKNFTIDKVEPGVGVTNKSLEFFPNLKNNEKGIIIARVSFEDNSGFHVLEKSLEFSVQNTAFNVIIAFFLMLLLLAIALFTRKKNKEKIETKEESEANPIKSMKENNEKKEDRQGYFLKNQE